MSVVQGDSRSEVTLEWTGYHVSSKPERKGVLWQKAALDWQGIPRKSKAEMRGKAHTNNSEAHGDLLPPHPGLPASCHRHRASAGRPASLHLVAQNWDRLALRQPAAGCHRLKRHPTAAPDWLLRAARLPQWPLWRLGQAVGLAAQLAALQWSLLCGPCAPRPAPPTSAATGRCDRGGWRFSNAVCLALNYPSLQICKGTKLRSWSAYLVRVGCVLQHPASPAVEPVVD